MELNGGAEPDHGRATAIADPFEARWAWKSGAVAGLIATVAMGLAITATDLSTLRLAIAGLYGFEGSLVVGWLAHLAHGTVFGAVFAAVRSDPGLYRLTERRWKTTLAGAVYGIVLAVGGAGIIMPIWLGVVGVSVPVTVPNVTVPVLWWHLLYGTVLGAVFPSIRTG